MNDGSWKRSKVTPYFMAAFALFALFLSGCSTHSKFMGSVPNASNDIPEGKAVVTFYRTDKQYIQFHAPLVRITGNRTEFLGSVSDGRKVRDEVDPGEYEYLIAGKGASLVKAKLEANKAYYVRISVITGGWKPHFVQEIMTPERLASKTILVDKIRGAKLVKNNMRGTWWHDRHREGIRKLLATGRAQYASEPEQEKRTHTLTPEDGLGTLY